jgi:hypothetical protein
MTDQELQQMIMMMWDLKKDTRTIAMTTGLSEALVERWLHHGLEGRRLEQAQTHPLPAAPGSSAT